MGGDVAVRTGGLDRLDRQIRGAARGAAAVYAEVLKRAISVCDEDPGAAGYLDVLELHSELAETYVRLAGSRRRCDTRTRWSSMGTVVSPIPGAAGRRS